MVGVGLLVLVGSWILALRPFAGSDEFAQAYRAASVARGEWIAAPAAAAHGSGAWVTVPDDIVRAAGAECEALPYTEPAECVGIQEGSSTTRVASTAGRYNPLFYALVGYPSLPFHGPWALLAMRTTNALACCLMLALALGVAARHAKSRWFPAGVLLACTPVLVYSCAVVAPNALEMAAALVLWCSLLGLSGSVEEGLDRSTAAAALLSALVLVTLRSLGPLWLVLIASIVLAATPGRRALVAALASTRLVRVGIAPLVLAGLASGAWIIAMRSAVLSAGSGGTFTWAEKLQAVVRNEPLWLFQSIAAFPYRDQPALPIVYACYLVLGVGLTAVFLWCCRANSSAMCAWVITLAATVVVPAFATFATVDRFGVAWQGRYGLPLGVGAIVLMAWAVDKSGVTLSGRLGLPAAALFLVAQVASVAHTARAQMAGDPTHGASHSLDPGVTWITVAATSSLLLVIVGVALLGPPRAKPVAPRSRWRSRIQLSTDSTRRCTVNGGAQRVAATQAPSLVAAAPESIDCSPRSIPAPSRSGREPSDGS